MLYRTRFPEDLFPPKREKVSSYNKSVEYGYSITRDYDLQIIGLAYNCESHIGINVERCQSLSKMFQSCNISILENASTDKTRAVLKEKGDIHDNLNVLIDSRSRPDFGPLDKERFEYMSSLRNDVLDSVRHNDFHFLMVYDFDIRGGFSYDGIMHSLSYMFHGLYDGVLSNGIIYEDGSGMRRMYDSLTYRKEDPLVKDENAGKLKFQRGEELVRVNSAFGGLGLYNRRCLRNRYNANYDCEHIGFNQGLNCYINPNQIVLYNESDYLR